MPEARQDDEHPVPPRLCIASGEAESSRRACEAPAPLIKAVPFLLHSFQSVPVTQGELTLLTARQAPRLCLAVIGQVQRRVGPGRMEVLCSEGSVPLPE